MKAVHIRNIDPATLDALKRLARSHHRSLQGELRAILGQAARLAPPRDGGDALSLVTVGGEDISATWSREEIYGDQGR